MRAVGAELGLPERLVWRQPFPGPGLAIRVVGGEATKQRLDTLRHADAILQDEIRQAGLYRDLWQSFCVLPDVRTVGVQGDERTYGYVVAIRAVTSDDAMTADWARLPVRPAGADRLAHDQRDPRGQPGGARHHVESRRARSSGNEHAAGRVRGRPGGGRSTRSPWSIRGDVAPGIVGGILAAVLVFLVIRRVEEHNAEKRRRMAARRDRPPG